MASSRSKNDAQADGFRFLLVGNASGIVGTQISSIAIPLIAVQELSLAASSVALISVAQGVPRLVSSLLAGHLTDRWNRSVLMRNAALVSASAACALWAVSVFSGPSLLLLLITSGIIAASGVFYSNASVSIVPSLTSPEKDVESQALIVRVGAISKAGGQAIAGSLIQVVGPVIATLADGFLQTLRGACAHKLAGQGASSSKTAVVTDNNGSVVSLLRRLGELRRAIFAAAILNLSGGYIGALFVVYAVRELGLSPFLLGLVFMTGSLAGFAVTFLQRSAMEIIPRSLFPVLTLATCVGSYWLIVIADSNPLAYLLAYEILFSASATLYVIWFAVLRQRVVPSEMMGRVVSLSNFIAIAALPAGALLASVSEAILGMRVSILSAAAFALLAPISLLGSYLNKSSGEKYSPTVKR